MTSIADSLTSSLRIDISPITECISSLAKQVEQQQRLLEQQQEELRQARQFETSTKQLLSQFKLTIEQISLRMTRTEQKTDVSSHVEEMRQMCDQVKTDTTTTRNILVEENEKIRKSMMEINDQLELVNTQHEDVKAEMRKQKELSLNVKLYCDQALSSVKTAIDSLEPQIRGAVQSLGEDVEDTIAERHAEMREYVNTRHDIVYDRVNKIEKRIVQLPDQGEVNDIRVRLADVENSVKRVYVDVNKAVSGSDSLRNEMETLQGVSKTMIGQISGLKRYIASRKGSSPNTGTNPSETDANGNLKQIDKEIQHHLSHPTLRDDLALTDASREKRRDIQLYDASDYADGGIAELEEAMNVLDSVGMNMGMIITPESKPDPESKNSETEGSEEKRARTSSASFHGQLVQAQSVEREVFGYRLRQSEEKLREAISGAR